MTAGTDPVLVVTGPTAQPFALSKDETTVGRSPDRDIQLNDNEVSRSHAVLTRRGGSTFLTDLGSRNGTFINGAPVKGTVELSDGDLISFASVQAIFHGALVRGAVRPPVVPDQPTPPPFGVESPDDLISTLPPRSAGEPHHPSRSDPPTDQGLRPPGSHPGGPAMQPGPLPPAHVSGAPPVRPPVSDPGAWSANSAPQGPGTAGPAVQAPGGAPTGQPPEAALEQVGGPPVLLTLAETRIGRVPGNDVVVPESHVSSRHALIRNQGGAFSIVDLGSSNGTYVNGQRIHEAFPLEPGDEIRIGETEFVFRRLTPVSRKRLKGGPTTPGRGQRGPGPKT